MALSAVLVCLQLHLVIMFLYIEARRLSSFLNGANNFISRLCARES